MGVYVYGLKRQSIKAILGSQALEVFAFKYLNRLGEESPGFWGEDKRRAAVVCRMQKKSDELFRELKPTFAVNMHEKFVRGLAVYTNLAGGTYADTKAMSDTCIGFLDSKDGKHWTIVPTIKIGTCTSSLENGKIKTEFDLVPIKPT